MKFTTGDFFCPHCAEKLDDGGTITLNTRRQNGDDGFILMNVSIGNYTFDHDPPVSFAKGELVDFFCPFCKLNLISSQYDEFAMLIMKASSTVEFELLFSREAGKRKTYVITDDGIQSYSEA